MPETPVDPNKPIKQEVNTTMSMPDMPLSDMEQRLICKFVVTKKKEWARNRREYEMRWQESYDAYRQKLPASHAWRSRVADGTTFGQVESITPRVVSALIPEPDFFEVQALNPDHIANEPSIKALLKYQLRRADFFTKFVNIVKQAVIYGTTFAKVPFREEYGLRRDRKVNFRKKRNPITGEVVTKAAGEVRDAKMSRVYYGPDIEVVDIYDIFADPLDPEMHELVEVKDRHWNYMVSRAKEGKFMNVEKLVGGGNRVQDDAEQGVARYRDQGIEDEKPPKTVTLLEYWGEYDWRGEGPEPVHFIVANEGTLVLAEPNPFWHGKPPYIKSQFIPVPGELYGIGIPRAIHSMQKRLNDLINQRNDNINLILNRMWKVHTLADVDLRRLESIPGRFILTNDMNGIEPLPTPDVTASSYQEQSALLQQVEQATGFSRFAAGLESGRSTPRAARTVLAFQQASLEKFGLTVRFLENNLLVPTLEMFMSHNQQFLDDFEWIRVTGAGGPEFLKVDPNIFRGEYQVRSLGASEILNKEQKLQGLMTFYPMALQDPTLDAGPIAEKIWRTMGNREELPRVQLPSAEAAPAQAGVGNNLQADANSVLTQGVLQPRTQPIPGGGT